MPLVSDRVKVLAGLGCLLAVVAIGLAVGRDPAPPKLDDAVRRHLHGWLEQRSYRGPVAKVAAERRSGHGTYVTAVVPLLGAAAVVATTPAVRRPRARAWLPWLAVLALTVPLALGLRVAFGRPGPDEGPVHAWSQGAYPSGGALLVALGWTIGAVMIVRLRPAWRSAVIGLAVLALAVHLFARVAIGDHWLTDVVGSYLLAAGVALLADRLRPSRDWR
jgi:membrane-associated phospholipid phosphatase